MEGRKRIRRRKRKGNDNKGGKGGKGGRELDRKKGGRVRWREEGRS